MIEFYIDTRVDLKTVFPHGPLTLRTLMLQGISNHWSSGAYQFGNRGTFDLKQRRVVRTDPVYKHADLAEAVRLEDVEKIKLRLVNDEHVNKSWSYLIYTLAMSEKAKLSIA